VIQTDVLVCGGGPSGIAAATMAARLGARVLLVERYGRLGGMAVQAMVGPFMGSVASPFVEETLARLGGRAVDWNRADLDLADILQKAGADILLHAWVFDALMATSSGEVSSPSSGFVGQGRGRGYLGLPRVAGVRLFTKQGTMDVQAAITVDATGDGDVAWKAGAPFEQGRPGDGLLQPASIMFQVAGVDESRAMFCGGERQARTVRVPGGTWEEVVHAGQERGELPPEIGVIRTYATRRPGERGINATQVNRVDGTRPEDLTRAELEGRRQAYQVLAFLQKHAPGYEDAYIAGMPAVVGVRETRRFLGLHYLTREDLVTGRKWPDAVVRDVSFVIDIHNPDGSGQAEELAAQVQPYDIPYGCLVPRETDGLLLAGRCISGSHEAHASYRVMAISMAIGAAAGAAAAIAVREGVQPREVDVAQVQRALA
jgi:hypothetical protein